MPNLHIPIQVINKNAVDIHKVVKDLAAVLHGTPADHDSQPISRGESHRTGKVFVDSVSGDTIVLTWALPVNAVAITRNNNTVPQGWVKAGTLVLQLGRIGTDFRIIADLTVVDGHVGSRSQGSLHAYPSDAVAEVWEDLWGPGRTWATLTSHLEASYSPGNPVLARRIQWVSLWVHNLAVLAYVVYALTIRGSLSSTDTFVFLGMSLTALLVVALAERHLVFNPIAEDTQSALSSLIPRR